MWSLGKGFVSQEEKIGAGGGSGVCVWGVHGGGGGGEAPIVFTTFLQRLLSPQDDSSCGTGDLCAVRNI